MTPGRVLSDYGLLLRSALLPVPEYCLKAGDGAFETLLRQHMAVLDGVFRSDAPELSGAVADAATLGLLLDKCPHDLPQQAGATPRR